MSDTMPRRIGCSVLRGDAEGAHASAATGTAAIAASPPEAWRGPSLLHRHDFRQVARLVDVAATQQGDVVRDVLQRYRGQQRLEQGRAVGHVNNIVRDAL